MQCLPSFMSLGSTVPLALGPDVVKDQLASLAAAQLPPPPPPPPRRESNQGRPSVDMQPSREPEAAPQYRSPITQQRSRANSSASDLPPTLEARSPPTRWKSRRSVPDTVEGPVVHPAWISGLRESEKSKDKRRVDSFQSFDAEDGDLGMMRSTTSTRSRSGSNASVTSNASSRLSQSLSMLFSLPSPHPYPEPPAKGLGIAPSPALSTKEEFQQFKPSPPLETLQEDEEFKTPDSPPAPHLRALEEGEEFPTPEIPQLEEFEGLGFAIPQLPALNLGGKLDWQPPSPTIKLFDDEEFDLASRSARRISKKVSFSKEKEIFTPHEEIPEAELGLNRQSTWGSFFFFPTAPPVAARPIPIRQTSMPSTRGQSPAPRGILRRTSSFEPARPEEKLTFSPKLEQNLQHISSKKEGRSLLRPALTQLPPFTPEPKQEKVADEPEVEAVNVETEIAPPELEVSQMEKEEPQTEKVEDFEPEEMLVIAAPVETDSAPVSPLVESSSWPSPASSMSSVHSRSSSIVSLASSQTSCFSPPQSQGCLSPPTGFYAFSPISEASSTFSPTTFSASKFTSIPLTPDTTYTTSPTASPQPNARVFISSSPNPDCEPRTSIKPNNAMIITQKSLKHWSETSDTNVRHWSYQGGVGGWVRKSGVYADGWMERDGMMVGPTGVAFGLGIRTPGQSGMGLGTRAMKGGRDRSMSEAPPVPRIPKEFGMDVA